MDDYSFAAAAKALGHPARVRIVRLLAAQSECLGVELFAELPLAQSTVSEHLRVLREAGIISSHAVGVSSVYCLCGRNLAQFAAVVSSLVLTPCSLDRGESACPE